MLCPNCQAEVRDGAAFCGSCGATIEQTTAAAGATEPLPQPTAPMPGPDPAAQAAYRRRWPNTSGRRRHTSRRSTPSRWLPTSRQKAEYDQQVYGQQAAYGAPGAQAVPPKKKTGLVVAIVIILILLLVGCGVGGFFAYKAWNDKNNETPGTTDTGTTDTDADDAETDDTDTDPGNMLDSYATADEAVMAQLEASGVGDWVYQPYDEGDGYATYWAGPPNSEYVDEIYLEQNTDGTWSVIEVSSLDFGGDVSMASPAERGDVDRRHAPLLRAERHGPGGAVAHRRSVPLRQRERGGLGWRVRLLHGRWLCRAVGRQLLGADHAVVVRQRRGLGVLGGPTEAGYMIADIRFME